MCIPSQKRVPYFYFSLRKASPPDPFIPIRIAIKKDYLNIERKKKDIYLRQVRLVAYGFFK